ncbi:MAG TPA: NUDIX domain-containing protein [Mycobacteriales bacterium]|nr:NUDIX domain-containing protein [Mycobacteriales bacterium]
MGTTVSRELLAAGCVVWRRADAGEAEVVLVHRPRYDDWSLPKGKVDPGEHLAQTARREVHEETGIDAPLRRFLGTTDYRVAAGRKRVRWWSMRAPDKPSQFVSDDEVDALVWLPVPHALRRLSYAHDAAPVRALAATREDTATVLLVRHAKAGRRSRWRGDDSERPLESLGRAQAQRISEVLPVWDPVRVVSADLVRCRQTVEPVAQRLGVEVESTPWLSDAAHAKNPKATLRKLRDLAAEGRSLIACSQGDTIPDLVVALARADNVPLGISSDTVSSSGVPCRKGSVWALSFAGSRLVGADYLPDLAPALPAAS